jgi:hypothetical protein
MVSEEEERREVVRVHPACGYLVHIEQVDVDVAELHRVRVAERDRDALVGSDDRLQLLHRRRLPHINDRQGPGMVSIRRRHPRYDGEVRIHCMVRFDRRLLPP